MALKASLVISVTVFISGCAGFVVHHAQSDELPHVAWEVYSGSAGNSKRVCASNRGDSACVLRASTADSLQIATVTLSLHAAAQNVRYLGNFRPTFFDELSEAHEVQADLPAGKTVKAVGAINSVTRVAGTYTLDVDLLASMAGTNHRIRFNIPVTVQ